MRVERYSPGREEARVLWFKRARKTSISGDPVLDALIERTNDEGAAERRRAVLQMEDEADLLEREAAARQRLEETKRKLALDS